MGAVTAVTAAAAFPLGFAVAAVTTVIVELRPARTLIRWGEGLAVDEGVTIAWPSRRYTLRAAA